MLIVNHRQAPNGTMTLTPDPNLSRGIFGNQICSKRCKTEP